MCAPIAAVAIPMTAAITIGMTAAIVVAAAIAIVVAAAVAIAVVWVITTHTAAWPCMAAAAAAIAAAASISGSTMLAWQAVSPAVAPCTTISTRYPGCRCPSSTQLAAHEPTASVTPAAA